METLSESDRGKLSIAVLKAMAARDELHMVSSHLAEVALDVGIIKKDRMIDEAGLISICNYHVLHGTKERDKSNPSAPPRPDTERHTPDLIEI